MSEIVQIISSVGFPIVMVLLMWYHTTHTTEDLKTSLDNNTLVLTRVLDALTRLEGLPHDER